MSRLVPRGAQSIYKAKPMQFSRITEDSKLKHVALRYILDAWEEALYDGIEPEMLANAALFAALSDLVTTYGEDAVSRMTEGLSQRIQHGEFTVNRITQ